MRRLRTFVQLLLPVALIPYFCFSETIDTTGKNVEYLAEHYRKLHTISDLVEAAPLPLSDYFFLKEKIRGHEQQKLPTIRKINNELQLKMNGEVFTLGVVSPEKGRFTFNHRSINLYDANTPQKRLSLFINALPSKTSKWQMFVPEAYADGGVSFAIAIIGVILAISSLIVSYRGIKVGARPNDQADCLARKTALDDCTQQYASVSTYVQTSAAESKKLEAGQKPFLKTPESEGEATAKTAQAENWQIVKSTVAQGGCTVWTPNDKLDTETAKVVSEAWRTWQTKEPLYWECSKDTEDHNAVMNCLKNIGETISSICFNRTRALMETVNELKPFVQPNKAIPSEGAVPPPILPVGDPPPPVNAVDTKK